MTMEKGLFSGIPLLCGQNYLNSFMYWFLEVNRRQRFSQSKIDLLQTIPKSGLLNSVTKYYPNL